MFNSKHCTDAKGFMRKGLMRMSKSLRKRQEEDEQSEVDAMADSFVNDEDLRDFDGKGNAGMEIMGTTQDGALDIDFSWDEDAAAKDASPGNKGHEERHRSRRASTDGRYKANLDVDTFSQRTSSSAGAPPMVRVGGRVAATSEPTGGEGEPYIRPAIPPLNIVIMIAGTRGDVQPFIALGLKLKEYGHRVRIATHKDYRKFVSSYDLEFYPMGGDPKILSDFIVKHRGVWTTNTKDAFENIKQVEEIVFSSYDACTQPDPEGDGRKFRAQAIIANPPSYGHIHCAEKLKIPLHIFFTMPWTPTRHFPHPLARIRNVRDTRPGSIAIRNYLSYILVNEYTYTGLGSTFNRFRREKLHLAPIRLGNSGPTIIDAHTVPFGYCWSPSLVPKPSDWDDHIDVTGYFFLNEGGRGSYTPPKDLADFLAAGPAPVYLGFGSLMVDDREHVTQKILDAFVITKQRLLLSKGWAGLGEGFDLPDTVMLLDDVPHDWLLPQCSAVVHHGGAGTTAAGLIAACPTTIIPFFGDQAFWGSAVYRRGVGPRPIAIDRLTTNRLVAALEFMQDPAVKQEALKVAEQIKAEDGVAQGVDAFHRNLPVEDLIAGKPKEWHLAKPSMANLFTEIGGGVADLIMDPVKGAREEGVKGAIKGMGKGVHHLTTRPLKGLYLSGCSVWDHVSNIGTPSSTKSGTLSAKSSNRSSSKLPSSSSQSMSSLSGPNASGNSSLPSIPSEQEAAAPSTDADVMPASYAEQAAVPAAGAARDAEAAKVAPQVGEPLDAEDNSDGDEDEDKPPEVGKSFKRTFSFRMAPHMTAVESQEQPSQAVHVDSEQS